MNGRDELTNEAVRLISEAAGQAIVLRALGSVGVSMHCDAAASDLSRRGREPKDIDLVTRKKDRRKMQSFFEDRGYQTDRDMLVSMEGTRFLFKKPETGIAIDVFVEVLDFCHPHDVGERMGPGPSLPIEDLLLSKLQIVDLTGNDLTDLSAIFGNHDVGERGDEEVIDGEYVAKVLADDWGFWRTGTGNLAKVEAELSDGAADRALRLRRVIDETPKTWRWKARARLGERAQWWQEVDIPRDTY